MSFEDKMAIRELVDFYSDACNRQDPIDMASVYTEDAELNAFGNIINGSAKMEAVFGQTIGGMEFMHQGCFAGVVKVDGDTATARWSVREHYRRNGKEELEMFIGNYEDEMVRTDAGWKFSKRVLTRKAQARFEGDMKR